MFIVKAVYWSQFASQSRCRTLSISLSGLRLRSIDQSCLSGLHVESKRGALKFNQLSPDEDLSFSHIPVQISVCRDQQKCLSDHSRVSEEVWPCGCTTGWIADNGSCRTFFFIGRAACVYPERRNPGQKSEWRTNRRSFRWRQLIGYFYVQNILVADVSIKTITQSCHGHVSTLKHFHLLELIKMIIELFYLIYIFNVFTAHCKHIHAPTHMFTHTHTLHM